MVLRSSPSSLWQWPRTIIVLLQGAGLSLALRDMLEELVGTEREKCRKVEPVEDGYNLVEKLEPQSPFGSVKRSLNLTEILFYFQNYLACCGDLNTQCKGA